MITISENIQLKPILASDSETLFRLMKEVYPLAYSHFWVDKGEIQFPVEEITIAGNLRGEAPDVT